jgi:hypothetical protein
LISISSRKALIGTRNILPKLTSNTTYFAKESYLLLIPVTIERPSSWIQTLIGYFDKSGMLHINSMLLKIAKEAAEEQARLIQELRYSIVEHQ